LASIGKTGEDAVVVPVRSVTEKEVIDHRIRSGAPLADKTRHKLDVCSRKAG
jgi:hypothetical protein